MPYSTDPCSATPIDDVERAACDLTAAGHARELGEADYAAFVSCLPKDILVTGAQAAGREDVRKSWSKPKFVDYYLERIPFPVAAQHCGARNFIALDGTRPIEFLLYLYFGKTKVDLKNFALRDLGILRTNRETSFNARFTDAEEALATFHYSRVLDSLEDRAEAVHRAAAVDVLAGPACTTEFAADLRSRAAHRTGLFFEKAGETDLARQLYRAGPSPACNERLVRLLYSTGDKVEAEALLQRMIDDPSMANTSSPRTSTPVSSVAGVQGSTPNFCGPAARSPSTTPIAAIPNRASPACCGPGGPRFSSPRTCCGTLFGLLFWEELFESTRMPSGFDWLPHCLKDRSFSRLFAATIEEKLAAIASGSSLPLILRTSQAKWGRPNGIFSWDHVQVEALRALLGDLIWPASPASLATCATTSAACGTAFRT